MLITTILGILLRILEVIPDYMMTILIVGTGVSLIIIMFKD